MKRRVAARSSLMRLVQDIAHATAFLTRLPVPPSVFADSRLDFSRQAWAFPLVSLPLAAAAGAVAGVSAWLHVGPLIGAVLAAATLILLTGALHEDGLADCADGFWGAREPERRLAIMRDSAVGTYGVLALIVVFSLRVAAIAALLTAHGSWLFAALLLGAAAFGRTALLYPWVLEPPAHRGDTGDKGESLAARFGRPDGRQTRAATALGLALLVPAALVAGPLALLPAIAFGGAAGLAATRIAHVKVGGHTGDTLGATALLAETGFLLGLLATTSPG